MNFSITFAKLNKQWRKTRKRPGRMPEDLWNLVVRLARRHGINPVAHPVGLDYYSLKRRLDASEATGRAARRASSRFVEVEVARPPPVSPQCVLELEGPRGRKMTLRVCGPVDVVALAEAFWRRVRQ